MQIKHVYPESYECKWEQPRTQYGRRVAADTEWDLVLRPNLETGVVLAVHVLRTHLSQISYRYAINRRWPCRRRIDRSRRHSYKQQLRRRRFRIVYTRHR
jgi:hypothetical protein